MGFTFAAFSYVLALILDAFLIFFSVFHVSSGFSSYPNYSSDCVYLPDFGPNLLVPVCRPKANPRIPLLFQVIAMDELKTDFKNPIDQCNTLNPVIMRRLQCLLA